MRQILGFYHICMVRNWKNIVIEQINAIKRSGLYTKTDKIFISCLGSLKNKSELELMLPDNLSVIFHDVNLKLCEIPILQHMQNLATKSSFFAWYIHTKGVFSGKNNWHIYNWRWMMEHFILFKHNTCLKLLNRNDCDACGIEIRTNCWDNTKYIRNKPFFMGNFWWSKSEYINKLPNITKEWNNSGRNRHVAEIFLGLSSSPRFYSMYNSGVNFYGESISQSVYKNTNRFFKLVGNKIIKTNIIKML